MAEKTNALNIAQDQFKEWTLSEDNRKQLLDRTKANIEAAWWDREAGLAKTREELKALEAQEPVQAIQEDTQIQETPMADNAPIVIEQKEEVKPVEAKAPVVTQKKQPAPTQQTKEELETKELETKVTTEQKANTVTEFNKLLDTWASLDTLKDFAVAYPDLKTELNASLRSYYWNKANLDFVQKYEAASESQLKDALINKDIVIGSKQYNLLPSETKAKISSLNNIITSTQKSDFTIDNNNILSLSNIEQMISGIYSFDLRKKYEEAKNNPALTSARNELEGIQNQISKQDDLIDNIEDDVKAEMPHATKSMIAAVVAERSKKFVRTKNSLVNQYNAKLATYQDMKSDLDMELKVAQFEDEQNKAKFQTALNIYQNERSRMDAQEAIAFKAENDRLAAEQDFIYKTTLEEYKAKLSIEAKWGDYIDDGKGNMVYVKNGRVETVLQWLWKNVSTWATNEYTFETKYNDKNGIYTTFIRNKNTGEVKIQTTNVDWDMPGGYVANIGTWQVTSYWWPHDNYKGLDIDGKMWDPIYALFDWKVVEAGSHKLYWTNIVVQDSLWNKVRYSHLWEEALPRIWDTFEKNAIIWTVWNSWNVVKMDWTKPTMKELAAGMWSHVDIVSYDETGKVRTSKETEQFLNNYWKDTVKIAYDTYDAPLYVKFNNNWLTATEIKTIPNFEDFKKKAEAYGAEKALPWYAKIERLVALAESLKGLWPVERKFPDNATDLDRILSKAGMQELINLKSQWATFWALSEKEFERIQDSILTVNAFTSAEKWNEILDDYIISLKSWLPASYKPTLTTWPQVITTTSGVKVDVNKYTNKIASPWASLWAQ